MTQIHRLVDDPLTATRLQENVCVPRVVGESLLADEISPNPVTANENMEAVNKQECSQDCPLGGSQVMHDVLYMWAGLIIQQVR